MRIFTRLSIVLLALSGSAFLFGQQPEKTWSDEEAARVVHSVQENLSSLSHFAVFDWITFGIKGKTIVLKGYASRPIVKDEAGAVVKNVTGVESVDNQIELLSLSPNDDRIRVAVYNRIYTNPALSRYNANQGSVARALAPWPNAAVRAGGITNSPPMGYHAIHIIVNNGHVILYGVVASSMDSEMAEIMANGAPGAFSIDNQIVTERHDQGHRELK